MKSNQRIVNIMSELVKNSLEAEASDINVNIKRNPEYFEITVQDDGGGMDEKTLENARKKINQPHRAVYEEYYSGLAGFQHSESGLEVVAFQIDEAEIETSPEGTTIRVKRDHHKNEKK